jgi:hypothetical protein
MKRKFLFRSAAVLALLVIAVFLYSIGKGSSLLLDNRTVEFGGSTYEAFVTVQVTVDGQEELELYPRDRLRADVTGAGHRITAVAFDRRGQELARRSERIRLPGGSRFYLLSLPVFLAGESGYLTAFQELQVRQPESAADTAGADELVPPVTEEPPVPAP